MSSTLGGARRLLAVLVPVLALAGSFPSAAAAGAQDADAAQVLAERYAPIVMVKAQDEECDTYGEPFAPMPVDVLLGNSQVALRQVGNGDPTVMRGPAASDLFNLGEGFYLDFPGDSLQPECIYERDHDRFNAGQPSVVYAHIAQQPDHPDQLALQYWLYWYYNDWNNKHESDWEFVQILFPASTVEEALSVDPSSVGYAQHEGGEHAAWDDEKLDREGTHPIVYSSVLSHASYFGSALFMGRSASEGFGCDNTDGPSTRIEPSVVVLPDAVDDPDDPLAWLAFEGRWGERHNPPNNGPTGPSSKPQWTEPIDWHQSLRDSSFIVPSGDSQGAQLVGTFCSVVEWGSVQFVKFVSSPARFLAVLAVVAALGWFLVQRTSWRRVEPLPVVRRRRAGEIARASLELYRRHPGVFAAAGLLAVPVGVLALLTGALIRRVPLVGSLVTISDTDGTGGRLVISAAITGVLGVLAFVVVSAVVAAIVGDPSGEPPSFSRALRAVGARSRDLAWAFVLAAVVILLLDLTVFAVPVSVWLTVRWQFMAQVATLEGLGARRALARSGELVRGRWFHTAVVTLIVGFIVTVTGLVIGLLLLIVFTALPLWALSVVMTLCNVLALPLGALIMTLLYGDAVASDTGADRAEPRPELVDA